MSISPKIIKQFTPTGKLRASINLGNPLLFKARLPSSDENHLFARLADIA